MQYKSKDSARRALQEITDLRVLPLADEQHSPGELELLDSLFYWEWQNRISKVRGERERSWKQCKSIGRALGLYPIPQHIRVLRRIQGIEPGHASGVYTAPTAGYYRSGGGQLFHARVGQEIPVGSRKINY